MWDWDRDPLRDLTLRAWDKLRDAETVYLRTARHPCVDALSASCNCVSFDEVYHCCQGFDEVYAEIAARVLSIARDAGEAVYAVPGDPLVGEATVTRVLELARAESIDVEIINGISFVEPCLSLLGIDALGWLAGA